MKKLLSLVLVMIMLITALTSCELLNQLFPTDDKPVETIRRTVTEEEWNANLEMSNFEISNESNIPTSSYLNISGKITENAVSLVGNEIELFAVCKDGIWYLLQKAEGEEEYSATNIDYPGIKLKDIMNFGAYADYSYDEKKGAYVTTEAESSIEVYFENGNIAKIEAYIMYDGEESYLKCYFKNVGTTVIDIPEFDITKRTVTEEEWNNSFDIINFEVAVELNHPQAYWVVSLKATEIGCWLTDNMDGTERFNACVCQNGVWYDLQKNGDAYVGTLSRDPSMTLGTYIEGTFEVPPYSEFTFDESRGAYVKAEIGDNMTQEMVLRFENGVLISFVVFAEWVDENGNEMTATMSFTISNVGTTVIDIPEFTIVE